MSARWGDDRGLHKGRSRGRTAELRANALFRSGRRISGVRRICPAAWLSFRAVPTLPTRRGVFSLIGWSEEPRQVAPSETFSAVLKPVS